MSRDLRAEALDVMLRTFIFEYTGEDYDDPVAEAEEDGYVVDDWRRALAAALDAFDLPGAVLRSRKGRTKCVEWEPPVPLDCAVCGVSVYDHPEPA